MTGVMAMFKSCSKCGKIHSTNFKCESIRKYKSTEESKERSKWCWTLKSKDIRERSHHLCAVCLDQGIYTYDNIEVHHIVKIKDDRSRLLDDDNLICLCQEHHREADNGQIDPEYLKALVHDRDSDFLRKK